MASSLKSCYICYEDYNHTENFPTTLQCGHTLCIACATKIKDHLEQTIVCPRCKQVQIASTAFTKNIDMLDLLGCVEPPVKVIEASSNKERHLCLLHSNEEIIAFIVKPEFEWLCRVCIQEKHAGSLNVRAIGEARAYFTALEKTIEQQTESEVVSEMLCQQNNHRLIQEWSRADRANTIDMFDGVCNYIRKKRDEHLKDIEELTNKALRQTERQAESIERYVRAHRQRKDLYAQLLYESRGHSDFQFIEKYVELPKLPAVPQIEDFAEKRNDLVVHFQDDFNGPLHALSRAVCDVHLVDFNVPGVHIHHNTARVCFSSNTAHVPPFGDGETSCKWIVEFALHSNGRCRASLVSITPDQVKIHPMFAISVNKINRIVVRQQYLKGSSLSEDNRSIVEDIVPDGHAFTIGSVFIASIVLEFPKEQ